LTVSILRVTILKENKIIHATPSLKAFFLTDTGKNLLLFPGPVKKKFIGGLKEVLRKIL
jgi:hypothetical protein